MKYNSEQIAKGIRQAVADAQALDTADDGGSCNFDCAYLSVPGMRKTQADEIQQLCGVHLSLTDSGFLGRILQIIGGKTGQANRNTKMAEAMRDSLNSQGFHACMFYMVD